MQNRMLSGALLVVGTTIGAGMLSLPLLTAATGFYMAVILLMLSWSVMYLTSLRLIHVCQDYPLGVNLTTLMRKRLPLIGQLMFVLIYLALLFALMAAYTTQGTELAASITHLQSNDSNNTMITAFNAVIFILVFGFIILNYRLSDQVNRWFVILKILFFAGSVVTMLGFFEIVYLNASPWSLASIVYAWPTLLTAFGFQNIVPVLYEYQKGNVKQIRQSVFYGSLFVLAIYIIWLVVCFSVLPQSGPSSYQSIYASGNTLSQLIQTIEATTNSHWIHAFLNMFINIAIVTSFLCVGLSLFHYLRDLFKRLGWEIHSLFVWIMTFILPFSFTVFYPKGFILALQYAAIFAVVVFVYMPTYLDQRRKPGAGFYAVLLGSSVIVAQICNLVGWSYPFGG